MRGKRIGVATVFVLLGLWLGYYVGHRDGLQEERRAWLATAQNITLSADSIGADGRVLPRPDTTARRIFYSNPHYGRRFIAQYGRPPVNVPDLRNTAVK